jgi:hypothetical protein
MEEYIDFCNLNPARTTTDPGDLEMWLLKHGIPFRHREGPAGDTTFLVRREDYPRAVELWGDYRGSADYIIEKHAPRPERRPPSPRPKTH